MKRVLIITYVFPPSGGAGVQRTAKFIGYLPNYDWLPTVLTVVPSVYGVIDTSNIAGIPESVEIIRTFYIDPVAKYSRQAEINTADGLKYNDTHSASIMGLFNKIIRALAVKMWITLEQYMLIPDQAVLWCPSAIRAGIKAHKHSKFDLIYATGEPYSAYITARTISRITGVPYVIDMRDPWTIATYRSERRPKWRKTIEKWLEKKMLAECRACIFANHSLDLYIEKYPQWTEKFHYLPNGFDASDFEEVEPKKFDKYTIVHNGTFLPGYRTADTFLVGLRALLDKQPDLTGQLQVMFVGKIGEERHLIADLHLDKVVHQTGYLPHRESLAYLKGADALLLVGGEHRWEETGKVYEYLAAGKPIIALVNPEGAAARLLQKYPKAILVNRECFEEAQTSLTFLVKNGMSTAANIKDDWISLYDRKRLTDNLAQILNQCL